MATVRVTPSFVSVQAIKPSTSFGTMGYPPIKVSSKEILTRIALPTIPKGSIITSAKLYVTQNEAWTGSNTIAIRRNLTSWPATVTWNKRPSVVATATDSVAKTNSAAFTLWEFDVTDDVQGWYARTIKYNWGWTLRTNSSTSHRVRGRKATTRHPYVIISYEPPAKVPSHLSPQGGAVSVSKPVLTFDTSDNTESIQVQIDAAADGASPDFDSGEVASTGGYLALTGTAYAGLADGSTTYWRARAKSAAGWSAWSSWVDFSREDLDAVTLTAPTATPADSTPPFAWTFGGTQTSWQADILLGTKVIRSSGRQSGTDNDWTAEPLDGAYFGKLLTARVRVFDDVTRIATPGVHTYSEDTVDYTATFTGTVDPMDTLVATQPVPASPGILLSGTRAAGIPDEVAVFHDDELVARLDGADVFTTSTDFEFTDWWGRMGREVVITVVAIVDGEFADGSPTDTIRPRCAGLWLVEPISGTAIVLWGTDQGSTEATDLAAESVTIDGKVVRRRLANTPRVGAQTGDIVDAKDLPADDTMAAFVEFAGNDASVVYRLIRGQENLAVLGGNFLTVPTALENLNDEVFSTGSFSWWGTAAPTVVDGG